MLEAGTSHFKKMRIYSFYGVQGIDKHCLFARIK